MKWVDVGQMLKVGERFGLIRFGSRVDVFLPAGYVPAVAVGQRAIAGETILAIAGVPLTGGLSVRAFCSAANVVNMFGYINRIS